MKATSKSTKKIRKGDKVVAIAGNYRGQVGVVLKKSGDKVTVQNLNLKKKHVKKSQQHPSGGTVSFEAPIHASNLKVCLGDDVGVKLKSRSNAEGERELVYRSNGELKVYRAVKNPKS